MKFIAFFHLVFLCTIACSDPKKESVPVDTNKETGIISSFMNDQQEAWNRADLEGFMSHYWNNDSLTFIGSRGITKGWKATLDNYRKGYPDPQSMGKLTFTNYSINIIDTANAYVIGKWQLDRIADTLSGHYTLFWKKIESKWVIVSDHSS